jgi:hypothetical protein
MTSTLTPHTSRATFAIGSELTARRVVDRLNESFFEGQAAIAAFERSDGRWDVTLHFAEAPDQTSIRELVGVAAGGDVAQAITFDTVEAKDWVKATLEELVPVRAGRFVVHGQHDRSRISPNKLGIEIEAALAFGTGHHGTTRGCLLLLDDVLKASRLKRVLDVGTAISIRSRFGWRARMRGSMVPVIWSRRSGQPGFRPRSSRSMGRSIWYWRIFSPIRCGRWRHRWQGISHHRRGSFYRGCCRIRLKA